MNRLVFSLNFSFGAIVGAVLFIVVNLLPFAQDHVLESWAAGFPFEFYSSGGSTFRDGISFIALIGDLLFVALAAGAFGFVFTLVGRRSSS